MNLAVFENLLKQGMGLDAASIGSSAVERAVRVRMAALGWDDAAAYAEEVRSSEAELQELIETIVVPETWFLRDREAFTALARLVYEEWVRTHPDGVLRVLSVPCSTGEEPYSIALTLLDAGLPPARFRVDAIDISQHALARAARAIYGKNSFRGADVEFRARHFSPAGALWQLRENVRQQVSFTRGNLLDPALLAGREGYDVIFCRNLLIYFDRPTQDRAVAGLSRLLTAEGLLFVGPSETGLLLSHGFDSVKVPLAFAFRRGVARPAETAAGPLVAKRLASAAKPPVSPRAAAVPRPARPVARTAGPAPVPAPAPASPLAEIARLADQGNLAEAATRCTEFLRTSTRSTKAWYLLGVVRDAAGQHEEAAELFRKVVYLDPEHHEALMHLAYLAERKGDVAAAKLLRTRARRAADRAKGAA